jgi:hypothetical protein
LNIDIWSCSQSSKLVALQDCSPSIMGLFFSLDSHSKL